MHRGLNFLKDLQHRVQMKEGRTERLDAGQHTIVGSRPTKIQCVSAPVKPSQTFKVLTGKCNAVLEAAKLSNYLLDGESSEKNGNNLSSHFFLNPKSASMLASFVISFPKN